MPALELSILVPTYNEAGIIEDTLREIARALGTELTAKTEILIVDDGTDELPKIVDKTSSKFGFAHVETLRNSPPLGKGLSLARGFQKAKAPIAGFLDADLSTPASYILMAHQALKSNKADIFIGSRRAQGSQVVREQSPLKEMLGTLLPYAVNSIVFASGARFRDTQCGFKFFKTPLAKILYSDLVAYDGMTDIEVLVRASLLDLRVEEQAVQWQDVRESKRRLSRIIVGDLKAITRIVVNYRIFGSNRIRKLKTAVGRMA